MRFLRLAPVLLATTLLGACSADDGVGTNDDNELTTKLLCDNGSGVRPFRLDKCAGKFSYLKVMVSKGGIKDLIDADGARQVPVASVETIAKAKNQFEHTVPEKVLFLFKTRDTGFNEMVGKLANHQATPLDYPAMIRGAIKQGDMFKPVPLAAVMIAPYLTIASGGGSQIFLDDTNRFINVGYKTGADVEVDVKSGRSFGATASRGALDPSDNFYLAELTKYLKTSDRAALYTSMLEILSASDASRMKSITPEGQTVITDFMAVYTAEEDRHIMAKFRSHPWELDLATATWVSSYVVSSGRLVIDGQLREGTPKDFFGVGENGSGIGETRRDRMDLQRRICKFYWDQNDTGIQELASITGTKVGGDVIQGMASFLTDTDRMDEALAKSKKLSQAGAAFLVRIGQDAEKITAAIQ